MSSAALACTSSRKRAREPEQEESETSKTVDGHGHGNGNGTFAITHVQVVLGDELAALIEKLPNEERKQIVRHTAHERSKVVTNPVTGRRQRIEPCFDIVYLPIAQYGAFLKAGARLVHYPDWTGQQANIARGQEPVLVKRVTVDEATRLVCN